MSIITQPTRVVVIPRPFTPLQGYVYWLLTKLDVGESAFLQEHFVRWTTVRDFRDGAGDNLLSPNSVIVNLAVDEQKLRNLLEEVTAARRKLACFGDWQARRDFKNFFCYGASHKAAWKIWRAYTGALSVYPDAHEALRYFCDTVNQMYDSKLSPVEAPVLITRPESRLFVGKKPLLAIEPPSKLSDTLTITLPVTKREKSRQAGDQTERYVIRHTTKSFLESEIFRIVDDRIVIVIAGNPGVGKSTYAGALIVEMRNIIDSLKSRKREWQKLVLNTELFSLDQATPVPAELLMSGAAVNKPLVDAQKRAWTMPLAEQTVHTVRALFTDQYADSYRRTGLVIADLPGKPTDITRLLTGCATFAIVIHPSDVDKWQESNRVWGDFCKDVGLPVIGTIKSTLGISMLSELRADHVYGRIRQPERIITGTDLFIRHCAEILLFSIIPHHMQKMRARIEHQAREALEFGF